MSSQAAPIKYPDDVQGAIGRILEHRRQIRINSAGMSTSLLGILGLTELWIAAASNSAPKQEFWLKFFPAAYSVFFGSIGYLMYAEHFEKYKKEYLDLFRAIHSPKNKKFMRMNFKTARVKYWIVDKKGKLVPKQKNPTIFGRPLGRRRIPNKLNTKKKNSKETWMRKPMRARKMHW